MIAISAMKVNIFVAPFLIARVFLVMIIIHFHRCVYLMTNVNELRRLPTIDFVH